MRVSQCRIQTFSPGWQKQIRDDIQSALDKDIAGNRVLPGGLALCIGASEGGLTHRELSVTPQTPNTSAAECPQWGGRPGMRHHHGDKRCGA
jgi:hypothetical protein